MFPAIFLDRDGTLIRLVPYLSRLEDISLIPRTVEGLHILRDVGYRLVVVTNQSGVARGLFDEAFVHEAHKRIQSMLLAENMAIDAFYYCPHHPEAGVAPYRVRCNCRKPLMGMPLRACADLDLDISRSWVIGDSESDMELASKLGCSSALVRTGYGAELEADEESMKRLSVTLVADDLHAAAVAISENMAKRE